MTHEEELEHCRRQITNLQAAGTKEVMKRRALQAIVLYLEERLAQGTLQDAEISRMVAQYRRGEPITERIK
jgi:hypothetical protein